MAWPEDDDTPGFVAQKPESTGAITDAMASPYVSLPFAALSAFMAGASPGTARASQALNAGLGMGMAGEKNAYEKLKKQRLSQAMGKIANATSSVTRDTKMPSTVYAPDTGEDSTPMSEVRLNEALKEIPTHKITENRPDYNARQRAILSTLAESGNGQAALSMMGQNAFREPKAPHVFGSAETGYHALGSNGDVAPLVAGVPKVVPPPTWRPFSRDLGDSVESGMMSSSGETKDVKTQPKGAAPARTQSPEDKDRAIAATGLARAQTQAALARADRTRDAIKTARDPKASTDKLTTELSVALRDQKNARDSGDEEGAIEATAVVSELRQSLAKRATERNAGEVMDKMPPAQAHKGKTIRDTQTGVRMKSDGKNWVPIEGDVSY